jgi:regulatory protein
MQESIQKKVNRLFKFRPRSEKELRDYLRFKAKLPANEVEEVIEELYAQDLLNDNRFAKWLFDSRLNSAKYGISRIKMELKQKGIDKQIIEDTIAEYDPVQLEAYEEENIERYFEKYQNQIPGEKDKIIKRIQRKGFSFNKIFKIADKFVFE